MLITIIWSMDLNLIIAFKRPILTLFHQQLIVSPDAHLSKNISAYIITRLSQQQNQSIIYLRLQQFLLLLRRVSFLCPSSLLTFSLRSILRFVFWCSSSDPLFMFSSLFTSSLTFSATFSFSSWSLFCLVRRYYFFLRRISSILRLLMYFSSFAMWLSFSSFSISF